MTTDDESIDPDLFRRAKANSIRIDRAFIARATARGIYRPWLAETVISHYVGYPNRSDTEAGAACVTVFDT